MGFFDQTGRAVKFTETGDSVTGKVISWREAQMTKYNPQGGTGDLDYWPDGTPKMQAIVSLEVDPDDDENGVRTLYVNSSRMKNALQAALRRGGSRMPDEGGLLTMTYEGPDPRSKNPANPAKMYSAQWVAPKGEAKSAEVKQEPVSVQKAEQPAAAQATEQSDPQEQQIRSLIGLGLDTAIIVTATGASAEKIDALR